MSKNKDFYHANEIYGKRDFSIGKKMALF